MKNWFKIIFSSQKKSAQEDVPTPAPEIHLLQNQLQNLRIELEMVQKQSDIYRQDIERLHIRQQEMVDINLESRTEALFSEVSAPASQLITQIDLFENKAKPVQVKDILLVVKRILRVFERNGMVFEGKPGEEVIFDPNRHTPISPEKSIDVGQTTTVRFSGVSYQGKIIYKAIVE